jgi:hypothetical protein
MMDRLGIAYGNVTKDGQQDVDEEISTAATLEENTEGREEDGKDDLADVGSGERHVVGLVVLWRESSVVACLRLKRGW